MYLSRLDLSVGQSIFISSSERCLKPYAADWWSFSLHHQHQLTPAPLHLELPHLKSAACHIIFFGTHPTFTQVPPKRQVSSTRATLAPY
mgnify:CR=1 FL=1